MEQLTVRPKLTNLSFDCSISSFSPLEFHVMEEDVAVMTPKAHAFDILQGDAGNMITVGHVLPSIVLIRRTIQNLDNSGVLESSQTLV